MLFLAGFSLSLLGSLPPGLISLTAAQTAIRHGLTAALTLSAAAAITEFFQAWLAAEAAGWFLQHPGAEQALKWAAVPVFLGLGGWLVGWAAPSPVNPTLDPSPKGEGGSDVLRDPTLDPSPLGEGSGVGLTGGEEDTAVPSFLRFFFRGTIVSLFNLLAIPYWLAYCAWLRTTDWWQGDWFSTILFSAGVTTGTFAALTAYAILGHFAVRRSKSIGQWANKIVGAIFIGLGLKVLIDLAF